MKGERKQGRVSGYTLWKHNCAQHDSWGKAYWHCRCGAYGFCNTEKQADAAILAHQHAMELMQPMPIAIAQSKYIKKLFEAQP